MNTHKEERKIMNHSKFSCLVKSANGKKVNIPLNREFAVEKYLIKKAIKMIKIVKDEEQYEVDMKIETGFERCVRTTEGKIVKLPSRGRKLIVSDDLPTKTTMLSIVVLKSNDGTYRVIDAHPGISTPAMPWAKANKDNPVGLKISKEFWKTHALAFGDEL